MKFEDYIINAHAAQAQCLDDDMPDNYDNWIEGLDSYDFIEMAEAWKKGEVEGLREALKAVQRLDYFQEHNALSKQVEQALKEAHNED